MKAAHCIANDKPIDYIAYDMSLAAGRLMKLITQAARKIEKGFIRQMYTDSSSATHWSNAYFQQGLPRSGRGFHASEITALGSATQRRGGSC
jgi:hypothetical protein